jgi:hypothetical protein
VHGLGTKLQVDRLGAYDRDMAGGLSSCPATWFVSEPDAARIRPARSERSDRRRRQLLALNCLKTGPSAPVRRFQLSSSDQLPNPARGPGVRRETEMRYKVNGSADMTDPPKVRACASPLVSMVRDLSATVASGASRIPFKRSSRIRRFPWRLLRLTLSHRFTFALVRDVRRAPSRIPSPDNGDGMCAAKISA